MKQWSFIEEDHDHEPKRKPRRARQGSSEAVILWSRRLPKLVAEKPRPQGRGSSLQIESVRRLRSGRCCKRIQTHCLQQRFSVSDPAVKDALHDISLFRRFARENISNETTMLRFRVLLETHGIGAQARATIHARLSERGLLFKAGMLVVATIITASNLETGVRATMNEERFFLVLASMVLAALLTGALASSQRSVIRGLGVCVGLSALQALVVLWLTQQVDTQGFAALLVIGAFMFSSVIAFSSSLALRRLRQARGLHKAAGNRTGEA